MTKLQKRMGGKIERASFDRAFHTPDNQEQLARIVPHPCIPKKGHQWPPTTRGSDVAFRQARQQSSRVWNRRSVRCKSAMARSVVVTGVSGATSVTSAWASWVATCTCWESCCWLKTMRLVRPPSPNASNRRAEMSLKLRPIRRNLAPSGTGARRKYLASPCEGMARRKAMRDSSVNDVSPRSSRRPI